jgi:hypothetical protein
MAAAMEIATQMTGAFSSTAQDLQRGCLTEIDLLNGYIARRGAELGVDVPVNHALFTLVKLVEGKAREREGPNIHGRFLRCIDFLMQNDANDRNAATIGLARSPLKSKAAQDREKLRKISLGN